METPYEPPNTNPEVADPKGIVRPSRKLAFIGCILLSGTLLGKIISSINLHIVLSRVNERNFDAIAFSNDVRTAMIPKIVGFAVGLIGLVLVSIALFRNINREKWFYRTVISLAILLGIFLYLIGLIFGLYLIIIFWIKRKEFQTKTTPQN